MKAAYLQNNHVHVGEVPDPVPSKGHALVRTHTCGLCASDAHFLHGGDAVVEMSRKFGGPYAKLDLGRVIVMGHEYVGEIVDYGPGSRRPLRTGTRVTSQPVVRTAGGHSIIGQSHDCPGGFGELMLLDENALMEIPGGLDDERAAMTEPLAVGLEHARSGEPRIGIDASFKIQPSHPMALSMHAMAQAIRGQGKARPDFDQAWQVERLQEAVRRSAAERRWVKLAEIS